MAAPRRLRDEKIVSWPTQKYLLPGLDVGAAFFLFPGIHFVGGG
jgi:hypothetical protein